MFTRNTLWGEVVDYPGMHKAERFLKEFPVVGMPDAEAEAERRNSSRRPFTLEQACAAVSPAWNPDSMAKGLNLLAEAVNDDAERVIELYTQEEKDAEPDKERTGLLWLPSEKKGPFALVCSGGAYMSIANIVEALPTTTKLNELGFTVFVLQYRAGTEGAARKSAEDLRNAVWFIFDHSEALNVEKRYIAFGFSAGGHLISQLGSTSQGYKRYDFPKPELIGLAYPLVSFQCTDGPQWDTVMQVMFADDRSDMMEYETISHVDAGYPRTFIMQTVEDEQVSYTANGLAFYNTLKEAGVPCRLKEVAHGLHGLGLGEDSEAEGWIEEAVSFWREH